MSELVGQQGLDALTDDDWRRIEQMAREYDDEFGDHLERLLAGREGIK